MSGPDPAREAYRPRLKRRLMLAFAGYTLLVGVLLGGLSMVFVYAVEDEFFADAVRAEAERQLAHRSRHGTWAKPVHPFIRLYVRDAPLPADLARALVAEPGSSEFVGDGGRHYHVLRLNADGALLVAEVSERLVVRRMRDTLVVWLLGAGGIAVLAALLLAWVLARRVSAPLETLARRVAQGAPAALPHGLAADLAHDEVGALARHLDRLHARTRQFIEREQALAADVSHELRTPLAVLGVACERLRARVPDDALPVVHSMQLSVWQLQQTVELLLAAARETSGEPLRGAAEPLLPLVERLILAHAPLLEQQGVAVEIDVPPALTRTWPPALAHVLLGNLLANAIVHAEQPWVRIEADETRLSVCNASGRPPDALLGDDAAGRSRGMKGSASAGHGLGLSIARRLVARHGLSLELSHRDGRTCATLRDAAAGGRTSGADAEWLPGLDSNQRPSD